MEAERGQGTPLRLRRIAEHCGQLLQLALLAAPGRCGRAMAGLHRQARPGHNARHRQGDRPGYRRAGKALRRARGRACRTSGPRTVPPAARGAVDADADRVTPWACRSRKGNSRCSSRAGRAAGWCRNYHAIGISTALRRGRHRQALADASIAQIWFGRVISVPRSRYG